MKEALDVDRGILSILYPVVKRRQTYGIVMYHGYVHSQLIYMVEHNK